MRKWIDQRLRQLGKTKMGLAEALGLEPARITEIIQGKRAVKVSEIPRMARHLDMDAGAVLAALAGESPPPAVVPPSGPAVPVIGHVQTGDWRADWQWPAERHGVLGLPPSFTGDTLASRLFAVEVRGPCMDLAYPEGSLLVCVAAEHGAELGDGDHVIMLRRDAAGLVEATVRELRIEDGGVWLIARSSRPEHQAPLQLRPGDDAPEMVAVVIAELRRRPRDPDRRRLKG